MSEHAETGATLPGRISGGLSYNQVRLLMLAGGLILLGLTALVTYVRRVETAEVAAILFFIPIFVAFVFWDWIGGLIAAAAATAGYIILREPAIHALGSGPFISLIFSRSIAFLAFGAIGGLGNQQLEASLTKLDLYDQIDDATGLYNARYFLQDTDLEMSRSKRYQTIFSVAVLDIPDRVVEGLGRRRRAATLRQLGHLLAESIRTVDRAVHAHDGRRHRFAVVLPETGREGVQVFGERLQQRVAEFLGQRGTQGLQGLGRIEITYPDDEDGLNELRDEFAAIERAEHPEHPSET